MTRLIDISSVLTDAIAKSLRASRRPDLAQQTEEAIVSRVTFDDSARAAYMRVEPSRALNIVEANIIGARHGETISLETEFGVVIDIDNFGRLSGIEILTPGVLCAELKRRASG